MRVIEAIKGETFRHGVFERMNRDQYREACGLNPSSLKKPSPLHVKHAYENQGETTDAMRFGTAVHTMLWEPHRFSEHIAVWEGDRRGKEWKAFEEANEDRTIIKADGEYGYNRAMDVVGALLANAKVKELAREGLAEVAVFTSESGLQCRGLIDWVATHCGVLTDLKVVNSIEPVRFGNAVQRYGWDVSMAAYRRWFQREANKEIKSVKFIAVESKPPHDVAVVNVDEATLEHGWRKASAMIERIRQCIEQNHWPGIANDQEAELFVPAYVMEESVEWEEV